MRRGVFPGLLLLLASVLGACAAAGPAAGPSPGVAEYAGREVLEVEIAGDVQLPRDSLHAIIITRPTQCRFPIVPLGLCIFGRDRYRLDLEELARDVARIQLYYRDHGFFGTRTIPSVEPVEEDGVAVRFAVIPGDRVVLRELAVEGTEEIIPPGELLRMIPLREGEAFRRAAFLASADTIRTALLQRGYAHAEVLRNYAIDTIADVAEAQFVAIPGPVVLVDTILFVGLDRLGERTARRALTLREGEVLRVAELEQSQRNLYRLELVNFASVQMATDTLQVLADSARTSVVARIVEAPKYLVDASAGYGTVDCLRTEARWLNRSFLGGARRLELSGSLSKIGVGEPFDAGLENSLCRALRRDEFSDRVSYRIAANFEQPQIFSPRTDLALNLRAERVAELGAFLREAWGSQVALSGRLSRYTFLTATADVERGVTRAAPAVFCIGFDVCTPEDRLALERVRWSNALSLAGLHDRSRIEGFYASGWQLRAGAAWASSWLGSDDRYLRLIADAVGYRPLGSGVILAGRLQGGIIPGWTMDRATSFIPPERRFYAGGPNSVRGFERNALGAVAYVADSVIVGPRGEEEFVNLRSSATGGTQMVVGSLELRMPSPILSQYMRIGAFVDAGQVWAASPNLVRGPIRFTPGLGLRFLTPVGPIRIDAAYNGYGRQVGPLYLIERESGQPTGNLTLYRRNFLPDDSGFWNRFQFHFAVGQAF